MGSPRSKLPPRSVRLPSCSKSWIFSSPISPTGRTNTEKSASNSSRLSTKWPDTNQTTFLLDTNQIFFFFAYQFLFFFFTSSNFLHSISAHNVPLLRKNRDRFDRRFDFIMGNI